MIYKYTEGCQIKPGIAYTFNSLRSVFIFMVCIPFFTYQFQLRLRFREKNRNINWKRWIFKVRIAKIVDNN